MKRRILFALVMSLLTTAGCHGDPASGAVSGPVTITHEALSLRRLSTGDDGGRLWYTYVLENKGRWGGKAEDLKVALRGFLEDQKRSAVRGQLGLGIAIYINEAEAKERQEKIAIYSSTREVVHYDRIYDDKVDEFVFPEDPTKNSELHFDSTLDDVVRHLNRSGVKCRLVKGSSLLGAGFEATLVAARNQYYLHKLDAELKKTKDRFWQNGRFVLSLSPRLMQSGERKGYFETDKLQETVVASFLSFKKANKEPKATGEPAP